MQNTFFIGRSFVSAIPTMGHRREFGSGDDIMEILTVQYDGEVEDRCGRLSIIVDVARIGGRGARGRFEVKFSTRHQGARLFYEQSEG
jgi:hypothetical protein